MPSQWRPIQGTDKIRTLYYGQSGQYLEMGGDNILLPSNIRLCELVDIDDAPASGLVMPDGPGWWVNNDESLGPLVVEIVKWKIEDDVVTLRYGHAPRASDDIVQHVLEFKRRNRGLWYRHTMPWQTAPAQPHSAGVPEWEQLFPPEWDRHPWANYACIQLSFSHMDGIRAMWYYWEKEPEWGEKSYNWVDGKHGFANPVERAPLSLFFDTRQTLRQRPGARGEGD